MLAFTTATPWRAAFTLLRTSPGSTAAISAGFPLRGLRAPGGVPPRAARMMADGPSEVGVAPPTDPTVETICALFLGRGRRRSPAGCGADVRLVHGTAAGGPLVG